MDRHVREVPQAPFAPQQSQAYSITSSARASTVGGMVRTSALAAFEVEYGFVLHRQLYRQIAWFLAFQVWST